MRTLLRSTFIAAPTDSPEAHLDNYRMLDGSGLGFSQPEDVAIWTFVKDFVSAHHHCPELETLRAHFDRNNETSVVDRLVAVATQKPRARGDFLLHLDHRAEERRTLLVGKFLQEASEIVQRGIEIKDRDGEGKFLKGPVAAMHYLVEKAHDIVVPTVGSKLSGNATKDGVDFLTEYDRVKADPLAGAGQFTGLQQMDEALGGAKRGELWTHAAFTGGMKSATMLNWAYNQAVYMGHSSVVFSLEMPYAQCRRILIAMHSGHEKFRRLNPPLDYQNIRDGKLTPKEEQFMREYVVPDLDDRDGANGYGNVNIEVADPDKLEFTMIDVRTKAETIFARDPFSLLFIDHAGLLASRGKYKSTTESLNEVIRDAKKMAMGFNKGMGMAVVILFQISREGFKAAKKAREAGTDHVYNLTFLSYANEAERSSDIVTASWLDEDLQKMNHVLYQCLKSRDQRPFEPFKAKVHWPSRRLSTMNVPGETASNAAGSEIDSLRDELTP